MVFLTYPNQIESLNLRTTTRFPVRIEATYAHQTPEGLALGIGPGLIITPSETNARKINEYLARMKSLRISA